MEIVDRVKLIILTDHACKRCLLLKARIEKKLSLIGFKYVRSSTDGYTPLKLRWYPLVVVTDLEDNLLGHVTPSLLDTLETIEKEVREVLEYGKST